MNPQSESPEATLIERQRRVMPSWQTAYFDEPLGLVSGNGRRVTGDDGLEYLDFFGGLLATMIGHNVPEIVDAIKSQSEKILHTSTLYPHEQRIRLAERLAEVSGLRDPRVFFVNSGSEAVETAFLLTTAKSKSNQVLALRGSYHGRSFATVAATGIRAWSPTSLSPLQVTYVHGGYKLRSPFRHLSESAYIDVCAEELRTTIDTATSGAVACMIVEPVQGAGGFATLPPGFLKRMQQVLDDYAIPLVSDEVQSGWGRTGSHFFGYQAHDVQPVALTFAKGLANGLPIGGVVAEADYMDVLGANSISTSGGNPLVMAAANAALDVIRDQHLQRNAAQVGARLRAGLEVIARESDEIAEVRGTGLMIGVELVAHDGITPAPQRAKQVMERARARGLLIGTGGLYGNVLRVTPPMTVTAEEADEALLLLREALLGAE